MGAVPDPDYYAIIERGTVERLATGDDRLARWAQEMISATNEEEVFLAGVKTYFANADRDKRRKALAFLAALFDADKKELKRYLRFKGVVNLMD